MMELMVRDGWRVGSEEAPKVAGTKALAKVA